MTLRGNLIMRLVIILTIGSHPFPKRMNSRIPPSGHIDGPTGFAGAVSLGTIQVLEVEFRLRPVHALSDELQFTHFLAYRERNVWKQEAPEFPSHRRR